MNRSWLASMVILAWLATAAPGQTPARVYIGCDDHTDYLWTADAATYRQAFIETLDYYLARADATDREPDDLQARFNCDGSLWLWEYERNRPPADFQRLIRRVKDGHISVPLTPITLCYGAMPAEAVIRSMAYAGTIERRFGLRLPTAHPMEDQTMPFGLGSLFAGCGAKYCWMGICGCATRVADHAAPRPHEIYWWTGRDGRKLLIKWNSFVSNTSLGGYAEARDPTRVVEFLDRDASFNGRWKYPLVKAAFGKGHDDLKTLTTEFETVAKALSRDDRRVRNSNEIDFFEDFEKTYGANLPTYAAAHGNEWELYPASMAEVSARLKRGVERLRAAEAVATVVCLRDPRFMAGREAARAQAFQNMGLYFNHDWTGDGPVKRDTFVAWARSLVDQVEAYVGSLHRDALAALGGLIPAIEGTDRFLVFNPLGWSRTDFADLPAAPAGAFHVIDCSTGQETPSQRVAIDGGEFLRILATGVPSVGYKVFEIRRGPGAAWPAAAAVNGGVIDHPRYRLSVDGRGAITSLVDKDRAGREFVASDAGRGLNDLGPATGDVAVENAGPVSVTLSATSPGPLPHVSRITVFRDLRRIEIRNDITENFQSVGDLPPQWGFGFAMSAPDLWHEEVGAVIRARLLKDGGHYAPDHSRYDWQTMNHFADMSSQGVGVTVSNWDCLFMKAGKSTLSRLDAMTPRFSVLAGGLIDGDGLGMPRQGGDRHFLQRFALQTHDGYRQAESMRFALEHQNPMLAARVSGRNPGLPETSFQLVEIDHPDVLLWSLKPADDGIDKAGVAVRLWNQSDRDVPFHLAMPPRGIRAARLATHIETPTGPARVTDQRLDDTIAGQAMNTYLLTTD